VDPDGFNPDPDLDQAFFLDPDPQILSSKNQYKSQKYL
jgi:hypothetical protein